MTEITGLGDLVSRILVRLADGSYTAGFAESFKRGSAFGSASIVEDPETPGDHELQVQMSVMRVPPGREGELFRRLLEMNHDLRGRAAFCLDDRGAVSLLAARAVEDLDPSEVVDLILWTSQQADRCDDTLLEEFGYEHAL